MATLPTVIPDDALDLTPQPAEFVQSFADIVGNAGTDSDGFILLFNDAADALAGAGDLLNGLLGDEGDIGTSLLDAGQVWEQDFSDRLAGAITQGQPDFDTFAVDLTGNNPPPPPTSPPTPTPTTGCDFTMAFDVKQPAPQSLCVLYCNDSGGPIHILSKTFTQDSDGVFSEKDDLPAMLQAGEAHWITITLEHTAPLGTKGLLTIVTDEPEQPDTVCCVVGQIQGGQTAPRARKVGSQITIRLDSGGNGSVNTCPKAPPQPTGCKVASSTHLTTKSGLLLSADGVSRKGQT